jgi:Holliday junction resolvase RusA-like endonuclease
VIELELPFIPANKKDLEIRRIGARVFPGVRKDARRHEEVVRWLAREVAGSALLYPDDSVRVTTTFDLDKGATRVTVAQVAPRPRGRSGRRFDPHNAVQTILDGLQGVVYQNDNQVCELIVQRIIHGRLS